MEKIKSKSAVPYRVKIAFTCVEIGQKITDLVMATFLLFFYTNAIGINPGVSATIILAAKIWDIINDPIMGGIVDSTHGKKGGNCRFFLKYGSVAMGLSLFLSLFVPVKSDIATVVWVTVTYVFYGMVSTFVFIPKATLLGRITSDDAERAAILQWANAGAIAASLLITSYTMRLVNYFGQGDLRHGFFVLGIIYGVITSVMIFITYLLTNGCEPADEKDEIHLENKQVKKEKGALRKNLKALMKNDIWIILVVLNLLNMTASGFGNSIMPFYFQYNFKSSDALYSLYSITGMVTMFIPVLTLKPVVKKLGPARTAGYGSLICAAGYLIRFLLHDGSLVVMGVGWTIAAIGGGYAGMVVLLMIYDSAVYGEWKTGVSNDAVLISGRSAAVKIGLALGGPIAGYSLLLVPYVKGAATQVQSVQNLFFYESTLLPLLLTLIPAAFYLTVIRRSEKRIPEMRKEIEARKADQEKLVTGGEQN